MSLGGNRSVLGARNAGVDAVRILGLVAVVAGHVWDGPLVRDGIYTWHVPLFFVLTGYFWKERPFPIEFKKRTRSLLVPYLAWLVIISAVYLPFELWRGKITPLEALDPLLGGDYIGRPYSAFWFMTSLFAAAILYWVIQRWPLWLQIAIAAAGLAFAYALPSAVAAVPLSAGQAVPCLAFLIAGTLLRRIRPHVSRPALVGGVLIIASAADIVSGFSAPLDLKRADFGTPVVSVLAAISISFGLVLLGEAVFAHVRPLVGNRISVAAGCGTMLILSHAMLLMVNVPARLLWAQFLAALLLPWAAALTVGRTRLSPVLVGTPQRTSRLEPVPVA